MEEETFEDCEDGFCDRTCDCCSLASAGFPDAETYSTSALMISSANSMAAMFSLMVSTMARIENAAYYQYPLGPDVPDVYANGIRKNSKKRKKTSTTKSIAELEFANEMSGAPVVK